MTITVCIISSENGFLCLLKDFCLIGLSRLWSVKEAAAIRFRQKALHFVSCLFCCIVTLRLNNDFAWKALHDKLMRNASDIEQMQKAHDEFVSDMVGVCMLNDASRPLMKAVQNGLECCEQFVASDGLSDVVTVVEPAFDANVQSFVKLVKGMLMQRKIPHLHGLLTMLTFNEGESEDFSK